MFSFAEGNASVFALFKQLTIWLYGVIFESEQQMIMKMKNAPRSSQDLGKKCIPASAI